MRILHRRPSREEPDFVAFVREVSPRLLRTAYVLGGSQDVAEDLVQEALERACRRWHRIAVADAPEAYVRQIVVNLANDRWRRLGRLRENGDGVLPDRPDPSDEYARLELREQLAMLLASLPIRMRTIIVLRYLHDMDDARIAETLGITPGAVRSQLSRGLAKLRGTMAGAAGPERSEEEQSDAGPPGGGPLQQSARPSARPSSAQSPSAQSSAQALAGLPLGGAR